MNVNALDARGRTDFSRMRTREEVEHAAYNQTQSQFPTLETNRLLYLLIEVMLDIRQVSQEILIRTPDDT